MQAWFSYLERKSQMKHPRAESREWCLSLGEAVDEIEQIEAA